MRPSNAFCVQLFDLNMLLQAKKNLLKNRVLRIAKLNFKIGLLNKNIGEKSNSKIQ